MLRKKYLTLLTILLDQNCLFYSFLPFLKGNIILTQLLSKFSCIYCTPCTVAFVMPIITLSFHKTCLNMILRFFFIFIAGSSFTKTKPKHGLMTVARLAVVRLVLLPLHSHWWAGQTSYSLYSALLLLYVLQIVNMLIYFNWPAHHIENHDTEVI